MARTLDKWKGIACVLAMGVFGIVPSLVITVNWISSRPISSLPLDYWLWLCLEAAGWLLIVALLRLLPPLFKTEALAKWRRNNSPGFWRLMAIVFAAIAVVGVFTGSFMPVAPAFGSTILGFLTLFYPKSWLRLRPKS